MQKKAYFFIVDSMVALAVLAVGTVLLLSMHSYSPPTQQSYTISDDIVNILSYNKIRSINNYYAGANSVLTKDGNITDTSKTLLEQMAEFYYRNQTKGCNFCMGLISSFVGNITRNMIPQEYNYIINIDNVTVFSHSTKPMNVSRFITPSRIIVHGVYHGNEMYGPYVVEVLSWG